MKSTFSPNRVAQIVGVPRDQILRWEDEGTLSPGRDKRNQRIFSSEDVRKALEMTGRRIRKRFSV